jgi:hypothetical protein
LQNRKGNYLRHENGTELIGKRRKWPHWMRVLSSVVRHFQGYYRQKATSPLEYAASRIVKERPFMAALSHDPQGLSFSSNP